MNLRIFLFGIAAVLSLIVLALAALFLVGVLSPLLYAACSAGVSIVLILTAFHFIYLYLHKRK